MDSCSDSEAYLSETGAEVKQATAHIDAFMKKKLGRRSLEDNMKLKILKQGVLKELNFIDQKKEERQRLDKE